MMMMKSGYYDDLDNNDVGDWGDDDDDDDVDNGYDVNAQFYFFGCK